jgi:hypothetical protein
VARHLTPVFCIVDSPPWLDTERWDVTAVGAPGTPADVLLALQQLLTERFSLTIRRESRGMPRRAHPWKCSVSSAPNSPGRTNRRATSKHPSTTFHDVVLRHERLSADNL